MKSLIGVAAVVMLAGPFVATAQTQSVAPQIAAAVRVLPQALRAAATVVAYDPATGARTVLRRGTNFIECQSRNPEDGFTRCYNRSLGSRRDLEVKLRAQKKSDKEIQDDKRDRIQNLWVMSLPGATPPSVGVSDVSQRVAALEGRGLPFMMLPGTPGAHIMIPINK